MAKSSKPRDEATQLLRYGFVNRIGDVLLFVNRMDMKSHPDYPGLGVKVEKDMKNGTLIATVSGYPTGVTGFHLRLECNRMNVTMEQMIVVVQQMTVDYEVVAPGTGN